MNSLTPTENHTHYISQGAGAPVIFIHGLAASLYDWKDLMPEMASNGFTGYALDLLGHGGSHKPARFEDYRIDKVFAHFDFWLDSLKRPEPLVLVGHSLGGFLAMEYALRYPERVRALVLGNPFYSLNQLPPLLRYHYQRPLINLNVVERAPEWMFRLAVDVTSLSIRNGYILSEDVRAQTAADYKRAHPGIFNILTQIRDLLPLAPKLNVPTLVIWGNRDQTLAPVSFTRLAAALPNAHTATLQAGHVPHQSHPRIFNRYVLQFLHSIGIAKDTSLELGYMQ